MAVTWAGATLGGVVRTTAYATDMSEYAEYTQAWDEASAGNLPASATVATPTPGFPRWPVELESIVRVSGE